MSRGNSWGELAIAKLYLRPNQKDLLKGEATAVRRGLITDQIAAWSAIVSLGLGFGTYFFTGRYLLVSAVCAFWVIGVPVYFLLKRRKMKQARQIELEKFRTKKKSL